MRRHAFVHDVVIRGAAISMCESSSSASRYAGIVIAPEVIAYSVSFCVGKRVPAAPAGLHPLRALQRHVIVPAVVITPRVEPDVRRSPTLQSWSLGHCSSCALEVF